MGESTSALVYNRTAVPENRAINHTAALEERRADSHSTRLPNGLVLLHQPALTVKSPDITELLAKHQRDEDWNNSVVPLASQPVYLVHTLKDSDFRMPVRQEEGNDALMAQMATMAAVTADQQTAANCCVCPPCNLL